MSDPETGFYYYGARYFDQEIGRFVSPDSYVQSPDLPQNLNRYSYVLNNPVNIVDPSGQFFWVPAIAMVVTALPTAAEVGTVAMTVATLKSAFIGLGAVMHVATKIQRDMELQNQKQRAPANQKNAHDARPQIRREEP